MSEDSYGHGLETGHFFLPGPTEVHPDVLAAQNHPVISHRGAGIQKLMEQMQTGLQAVFMTERSVFVSTSSATGLMEAAIRNGVRRKVLCLVNGAFSQRFADIAHACEREVETIEVAWGETIDPGLVRERLATGEFDAVTVVHSETSTGVLHDLKAISSVVQKFENVLFMVDSVTGAGGAELRTDEWGLDFVLTGSHKALAMPPGLSFGVASERMMARARTLPGRGMYFDLVAFEKNAASFQTPTTPAVTLMYAAAEQLARITAETLPTRWARHLEMSAQTKAWTQAMADRGAGLTVLAPEGNQSPTVTCICLPEGGDGPSVVKGMQERGFVIGGGYGQLKPDAFRIGHMGDHTPDELALVLHTLTEVFS